MVKAQVKSQRIRWENKNGLTVITVNKNSTAGTKVYNNNFEWVVHVQQFAE